MREVRRGIWGLAISLLLAVGCRTTAPKTAHGDPTTESCRCEDGCAAACAVADDQTTTYRKVVREPSPNQPANTEPVDAFEPLDVQAADPLDPDALASALGELSKPPDDVLVGFRADFTRSRGDELALLTASGELSIYHGTERVASLTLGSPLPDDPALAVRLVDDRTEIVVRHHEEDRDRLTICRVIGEAIARVFETDLADREIAFVHLGDERAIRVTDAEGAAVYRWNKWEGMFRIPTVVPTAPSPDRTP